MITFDQAVAIAKAIPGSPDNRPEWLLNRHAATIATDLYYRFLYELPRPFDAIEIGTLYGTSAAHLAWANTGKVITIDIAPGSKEMVDDMVQDLPRLTAITGTSTEVLPSLQGLKVDVLYVDGCHDFGSAYTEYSTYRNLVRDGGIMLFDDIHFPCSGDEMSVFWDFVVEPKAEVNWLHTAVNTGWGIVQKVDSLVVRSFQEVWNEAGAIIASRR